jgi:hypothetical protein
VRAARIVLAVLGFSARYAPPVVLLGSVVWIVGWAAISGEPPVPSSPPAGHVFETTKIELEWSRGDAKGRAHLTVALDGDFDHPIFDQEVPGDRKRLLDLRRGGTYSWRIVQDGHGFVRWFRVAPHAVAF